MSSEARSAASESFSPEIEVMATCIEQIEALTPEERERVMSWLWDRVFGDRWLGRECRNQRRLLRRCWRPARERRHPTEDKRLARSEWWDKRP